MISVAPTNGMASIRPIAPDPRPEKHYLGIKDIHGKKVQTNHRAQDHGNPGLVPYDRLSLAQTTRPLSSGVTKPVRNLAPVASDLSATREHAASRYRLGRKCTLQSDLGHDSLRFPCSSTAA